MRAAAPRPWATRYPADIAAFLAQSPERFDTLWLSDGLDHPGRPALLKALNRKGAVTVVPPAGAVRSLMLSDATPPALTLMSSKPGPLPAVLAFGPDPQGVVRQQGRLTPGTPIQGADGVVRATLPIDLPLEVRNRLTRFEVEADPSAGAVVLADDRVRRRKVALIGDRRATEGQNLLSPLHYVRQALAPSTELVEGDLAEVLPAAPDVVILVDADPGRDGTQLAEWVKSGGLLIRFAGPRMAASESLDEDPLLPVRLRPGGRDAGGALSWGEPRNIAPFDTDGMFQGLAVAPDVTVRAQLLPEPDPDLPSRTLARLSDGTPLVTRDGLGQGQIVLVHSSANAEWGNLALSGMFVAILDRLVQSAGRVALSDEARTQPVPHWTAELILDGFGRSQSPGAMSPVPAAEFSAGPGPRVPSGLYAAGERRAALNAGAPLTLASWPGAVVEAAGKGQGIPLAGWLLTLAAALLAADALGSVMIAGHRRNLRGLRP